MSAKLAPATRRPRYWVVGTLLFLAIALFARDTARPKPKPDLPTYKVNVKVVNVLATVRDKHGKIVNHLGKDDFTLLENGRPQTIRYFTRETDIPLTLGLLVDTSFSQSRVLDQEQTASKAFTNDVLRADKDSAFLIQFSRDVELLEDVTKSPPNMQSALDRLSGPKFDDRRTTSQGGGSYPDPDGDGDPGGGGSGGGRRGGTLLYDAVYLAAHEMMQKQQGRKAIVLLTDGVDHGSKMSLDRAIESAQRANTMVYSIYFTGEQNMRGRWEHPGGVGGGGRGGGWPGGGGGWPGGGGGWPGGGGGWPGGGGGYPGGGYPGGGGRYPRRQHREPADGKKILERLSRQTGGRMFEVSKKKSISKIYQEIQDELRNQYDIGYTPDRAAGDTSDYRQIQLTTRKKGMQVQARQGYYASKPMELKEGE